MKKIFPELVPGDIVTSVYDDEFGTVIWGDKEVSGARDFKKPQVAIVVAILNTATPSLRRVYVFWNDSNFGWSRNQHLKLVK